MLQNTNCDKSFLYYRAILQTTIAEIIHWLRITLTGTSNLSTGNMYTIYQ